MPIDRVVVDASPLIVLFRCGLQELLPTLFQEVLVPEPVWHEVTASGHADPAASGLPHATWIKRVDVPVSEQVVRWNLGPGESAVLSLTLIKPEYRAMLDDSAARRCARTLGIRTLGSGGLLVLAKRRGRLDSVAEGVNKLKAAGLWLSDDLTELLLREAGETVD